MRPLISLDVFDTAIFRKVFYPTDIFALVEDEVGKDFKNKRIQAQERVRLKNPSYTLLDIYKELPLFSPKEEIKAELTNCEANPYILNMYKTLDCDFVFISDMYLPSSVIKAMLERCGYKNPKVFVSCEYRAGKGNGMLFRKVESALSRKINKHIGDNYLADIEGAKQGGISEAEYIGPPIYDREVVTPNLQNIKLRKILINEELSDNSVAEKIGYQFAPLTLAFTQKVLSEAKEGQTVFFNARDGFLLYIVARWILKTKKKIKYCRFSRKSCLLADVLTKYPLFHSYNSPSLNFFRNLRVRTLKDFLIVVGVKEVNIPNTLNKYNITLNTDIALHPKRSNILESAAVEMQDILYSKASECRQNFLKYIQKIGMKNGDIFVDLGYAGTIQGIIKRITGIDLKGLYVNNYRAGMGNYMGVRYSKESFLPINLVGCHGGVIETIFSELKGTVIGYTSEGKPILLEDLKSRRESSKALLRGVLKGVKEILKEGLKVSCSDCVTLFKRYIENPTYEESLFGNKCTFENGAINNEGLVGVDEFLIKGGKLKECYLRSYWKEAFKVIIKNNPKYKSLTGLLK